MNTIYLIIGRGTQKIKGSKKWSKNGRKQRSRDKYHEGEVCVANITFDMEAFQRVHGHK